MSRGRQFKVSALVVALMVFGWWAVNTTGPKYRGRGAAYWFRQLEYGSETPREETMAAFRSMGEQTVPFLVEELKESRFRELHKMLWNLLGSIRLQFRLWGDIYDQRLESKRANAALLLGEIGEPAQVALPALKFATNDSFWYVANAAKGALIKIRHESLNPYIERLKDRKDFTQWYENAMLVADFGTNASAAVPILLESLHYTNEIIQAHAIIALGMIRVDPKACVPAVAPFLSDPSVALRQKSIFALIRFGTDAQSASNQIVRALSDSDPWMRSQALQAVLDVFPPPVQRNTLPAAERLLNDPEPYVSKSAKKLLPRIRASAAAK